MKQWFVAYTHPHKEDLAQHHLHLQNFETYCPRYKRIRHHARKIDTIFAPLFPRYLFVSIDLAKDRWRSINGTRGIHYLLMRQDKPVVISTLMIDSLRMKEDDEGAVPVTSLMLFAQGQQVNITQGFFEGHTATFEKMNDNHRVKLLLKFLGQEQHIDIPLYAVDAA